MRFIVDQAVSWQVAEALTKAGHDAIHVRDVGRANAPDESILELAAADRRIIISQDTDFGTLLVRAGGKHPSVVLLRMRDARPETHARTILQNLPQIARDLESGAIVVIEDARIRVRRLS